MLMANKANISTVKDARKAAGLTQQQLADWLGIPKRTIGSWDAGERECPEWCKEILISIILNADEYEKIRVRTDDK